MGGVLATAPASADNFSGPSGAVAACDRGDPGGVNMADAQPHTYWYSANVAANHSVRIHQDWAWNTVFGPTSVEPLPVASPTTATDVVVYAQDYSNYCGRRWHPQPSGTPATLGLVVCVSLNPGAQTCEKHETRYDLGWWNGGQDDVFRRNVACHETGHTLGLLHTPDTGSCLYESTRPVDVVTEHDVAHLNGGWPTLYPNWRLDEGGQLASWDGRYRVLMQGDGNVVLYDTCCGAWAARWASDTFSPWTTWAAMQGDGNFVVYASDGFGTWPLCSTRTNGRNGTLMRIQTDGNLVLYAPPYTAIWSTSGGGRCQ